MALICTLMLLSMALFLVPNTEAESGLTGGIQAVHLNMKEASDLSCLLYTSPSPRDGLLSRMPSSA